MIYDVNATYVNNNRANTTHVEKPEWTESDFLGCDLLELRMRCDWIWFIQCVCNVYTVPGQLDRTKRYRNLKRMIVNICDGK